MVIIDAPTPQIKEENHPKQKKKKMLDNLNIPIYIHSF